MSGSTSRIVTAPELGIIEGYYGLPWGWAERRQTISFLRPHGYSFFIYAPKADEFLRKRWREDHPDEVTEHLRALSSHCRSLGVRFGVGLSPFEIYRKFDAPAKAALMRKISLLDAIGIDDLALQFDDMHGDVPDLARTQVEIAHQVKAITRASRLIVCPSYYADDPGLDHLFGKRPDGYLEDLGRLLDPSIGIFWTGEEVCSRAYSTSHIARVGDQLRRKPFLWDNYPVNDGRRMSNFLHIRAFTGRPASVGPLLSAHAINPALQPVLTRIPALTLAESYARGEAYEYDRAFRRAAIEVAGQKTGELLRLYLVLLNDTGLGQLGRFSTQLRKIFSATDHPAAREIIAWLDGKYRFEEEIA